MGKMTALVLGLAALGCVVAVFTIGLGGLALLAQKIWRKVLRRPGPSLPCVRCGRPGVLIDGIATCAFCKETVQGFKRYLESTGPKKDG